MASRPNKRKPSTGPKGPKAKSKRPDTQAFIWGLVIRCVGAHTSLLDSDDAFAKAFNATPAEGGWAAANTDERQLEKWGFQRELGTENQHEHLQCYLKLKKKQRKSAVLAQLDDYLKSNEYTTEWEESGTPAERRQALQLCRGSTKGIVALRSYCCKQETRKEGHKPRSHDHPLGIPTPYDGADVLCVETDPLPWQKKVLDIMKLDTKNPPHNRRINWIVNKAGCAGKSVFVKYCVWKGLAKFIPLGTATQIKSNIVKQGAARVYLLDLPRVSGSTEKRSDTFSSIEACKNGMVLDSMYGQNNMLLMKNPHVFVYANQMPDFKYASADRWKVWKLTDMNAPLEDITTSAHRLYRQWQDERASARAARNATTPESIAANYENVFSSIFVRPDEIVGNDNEPLDIPASVEITSQTLQDVTSDLQGDQHEEFDSEEEAELALDAEMDNGYHSEEY